MLTIRLAALTIHSTINKRNEKVIITITPSEQAFGTQLTRLVLTQPLDSQAVATIKSASLVHHVHSFPQQAMNDDDLDCFGQYMGPFGNNPFTSPSTDRSHIIAIKHSANKTSTLFAEGLHADRSFQENPPIGTCLFGITIPPHDGDTLYINQCKTSVEMSTKMRIKIEGKFAIYSAATVYAPQDLHDTADEESDRNKSRIVI